MGKEFSRSRRVADQIQRHMAEIIQRELADPRLGMVTVTAVEVTHEFERARVYFSVLGNQEDVDTTAKVLNQAAGFLRHELSKRIKLRITPELDFIYDKSLETGNRMDALIKRAVAADHHEAPQQPSDDSDE